MLRMNAILGAGLVSLVTAAPAFSAVAYYRFENNLTSQDNSPTLDATAGSTVGYSSDVPGSSIFDPIGSTTVANTKSYDHGTGSASTLSDTSILNNTVSTHGFTIEAFIKLSSSDVNDVKFDLIFGNMNGAGTEGWLFGINGSGKLRFSGVQNNGAAYKEVSSTDALTANTWHHVAAVGTFSERTGQDLVDFTDVQLFVDYVATGSSVRFFGPTSSGSSGNSGPNFATSTANYNIGANNPFSGLIDELRIYDSPLMTTQMLQAVVPEPASLGLLGLGGLLLVRRRKA
ncbi:MAG: LamG domain-containing protein [Phycisphaerales bacterium]|nr:LamG domain-containing protein [Phycisphaerales bacterium]